MLGFQELDPATTLKDQYADHSGLPTVMLNLLRVGPKDTEAFKAAWAADAKFFKGQPGWISAQLHQGVGDSNLWFNYAMFETTQAFAAMNDRPEFKDLRKISRRRRRLSAPLPPRRGAGYLHRRELGPSTAKDPRTALRGCARRSR